MDFTKRLPGSWATALESVFDRVEIKSLQSKLALDYAEKNIFPPQDKIFQAFHLTPLAEVKVVILGQDPYFHPGQAEGLAFSVPQGEKIPSSLKNIHLALSEDLGLTPPTHGSLRAWAKQGVLLLNTALTVQTVVKKVKNKEKYEAQAHQTLNWQIFTDFVIETVSQDKKPKVFLLWGKQAQKKRGLVDEKRHLVLETVHPSGLSAWRGFKECGHFSKANEFLLAQGREPVEWKLE
ncbi:MAG: uracil-DNA glycosylase [Firmicutes bacterium]|nr:uracil-DNA glycosylase [Bacillota bacterium]